MQMGDFGVIRDVLGKCFSLQLECMSSTMHKRKWCQNEEVSDIAPEGSVEIMLSILEIILMGDIVDQRALMIKWIIE